MNSLTILKAVLKPGGSRSRTGWSAIRSVSKAMVERSEAQRKQTKIVAPNRVHAGKILLRNKAESYAILIFRRASVEAATLLYVSRADGGIRYGRRR